MTNSTNLTNSNHFTQSAVQLLPAGIFTKDNCIEAFGIKEERKVIFYQNGKHLFIHELPHLLLVEIDEFLQTKPLAVAYLNKHFSTYLEKLEEFIFCMWGQSDHIADFKLEAGKWVLANPENFTCSKGEQCHCFSWFSKTNHINDVVINTRELFMIRNIYRNLPDKQIANMMNISQSTYDYHKHKLLTKLNITTSKQLIVLALEHKLI